MSKDGSIFTGQEDKRLLTHNVMSLQKGYYSLVGRCISLALVYGGTGPHIFSESVTSYIFNEDNAAIEEISDDMLRRKIRKVRYIPCSRKLFSLERISPTPANFILQKVLMK